MLLRKSSYTILFVLFLVFSNFWIYRILKENFSVGLLIAATSLLIGWLWDTKYAFKVIFLGVLALMLFQFNTTDPQSLTILENDQQRVQQERIRAYPLTYVDFYFKIVWLKPVEWIEKNNFVIGLSRVEQNIFENLDINKFFFAGSPRNKPDDFEKFSFILLPVFILGIVDLIRRKRYTILGITFIPPLILLTFIGDKNYLGPFVLSPFFILSFIAGIHFLETHFKDKKIVTRISLIVLILLGFLIQISYGKI